MAKTDLRLDDPDRLAAVSAAKQVLLVTSMSLDAVAQLAALLNETPMAVVSLVGAQDEEFVGAYGLPSSLASVRRADRATGLCSYVVAHDEPVAVADMTAVAELESHPLVVQSLVRAFAGAPLRDARGQPIGAVTVVDAAPRQWSPVEMSAVTKIAHALTLAADDFPPDIYSVLSWPAQSHRTSDAAVSAAAGMRVQRWLLDALLDNLQVGVVAFDNRSRPVLFNRALRTAYGIAESASPVEAMAVAYEQLHRPDGTHLPSEELAVARALRGEIVRDLPSLLIAPGMPDRHLLANAQPICSPSGEQIGAVASLIDITERRRSERFRDCQLQIATILNRTDDVDRAGPDIVKALGTALDWAYVSLWLVDEVTDVLRRTVDWTAPGRDISQVVPETVRRGECAVGTAWETGTTLWVADYPHSKFADEPVTSGFVRACSEQGLCTVLAVPIRDGNTVLGALGCLCATAEYDEFLLTGLLEDVATQIGYFLARQRASELSLQLARAKDDFVALVGHEMRTPLTSIVTCSDLLLEDPHNDDSTQNMLEVLSRNAGRLRAIIESLLDLAALDSGHFQLRSGPVDLAQVVGAALADAPGLPSGLELRSRIAVDAVVLGDEYRLRQVVDSLLSNAIKYSPDGGDIDVELTVRDHVVVLAITDTGVGIPDDEREQVFDRFYRGSNVQHSSLRGTGLGLIRARTIVEAHRGTITLDTRHSRGTCVVVRLPHAGGVS